MRAGGGGGVRVPCKRGASIVWFPPKGHNSLHRFKFQCGTGYVQQQHEYPYVRTDQQYVVYPPCSIEPTWPFSRCTRTAVVSMLYNMFYCKMVSCILPVRLASRSVQSSLVLADAARHALLVLELTTYEHLHLVYI